MSVRRLGVAFLLAQAVGATLWWSLLLAWPPSRIPFMAREAPDSTLLAFAVADGVLFIGASALAAYGLGMVRPWAWPVLCVHAGAATYAGLYCWTLVALTGGDGLLGAALMSPSSIVPGVLVWLLRPGRPEPVLTYFHGRQARHASWGWNLFKTLSQTAMFWVVFLLLLPAGIFALEQVLGLENWRFAGPASRWAGGLLFVLGGSLGLTSGVIMAIQGRGTPLPADCPRELVVVGPYRYIRNPMAVAGLAQGVAVGVFLGSPAVVAYAFAGGPVWNVFVRPWEEADLERRFGDPYRRYRDAVRCWLPCFPGYRPAVAVLPRQAIQ